MAYVVERARITRAELCSKSQIYQRRTICCIVHSTKFTFLDFRLCNYISSFKIINSDRASNRFLQNPQEECKFLKCLALSQRCQRQDDFHPLSETTSVSSVINWML